MIVVSPYVTSQPG